MLNSYSHVSAKKLQLQNKDSNGKAQRNTESEKQRKWAMFMSVNYSRLMIGTSGGLL
jgi:hypothetical protein